MRELLLTHIPPWTSREDVISEAKAEFDGPVHAVVCGETFDVIGTLIASNTGDRVGGCPDEKTAASMTSCDR